ncbi:MAG: dethiobiotin synthase [Zetaproteobacteria bacterium]|nr:dethiobiotin synthase [Zetaproteobacteria bacterium]
MSLISGSRFFVTGIGTDVGKTIVSSILMKAVNGLYWKPIQCGTEPITDCSRVRQLTGYAEQHFLPEKYLLKKPASPHLAAPEEGVTVCLDDIVLPIERTDSRNLVVEGAGGVMVPLNCNDTVGDLALHLGLSTVVVASPYLGAYNHTLLTIEALRRRCVSLLGIVVSHVATTDYDPDFISFVEKKTGLPVLLEVPYLPRVTPEAISVLSAQLKQTLESENYYGKVREQSVAPLYSAKDSSPADRIQ